HNFAALDVATGEASAWNPHARGNGNSPSAVGALAVSGDNVYAGGRFTSIGGRARHNIAALDADTGQPTGWNPGADGEVDALVVSGGRVFASGEFHNIGGQARTYIAALDTATGQATAWNPDAQGGGFIFGLAVSSG